MVPLVFLIALQLCVFVHRCTKVSHVMYAQIDFLKNVKKNCRYKVISVMSLN